MKDADTFRCDRTTANHRCTAQHFDRLTSRIRQHAAHSTTLTVLLAILLTACSNGDGSDGTPIPTATQPTATTAASPSVSSSPAATGTPTLTATSTATEPATPTPGASPTEPAAAGGTPVYGYRIVNTYPHDPRAFIQGLDIADGILYEGTGLNGRSSLRRVELETGAVLQQADVSEEYFGEGIVVLGERIYQITYQEQQAFVYDRTTFEVLETHSYPTQGWGLTTDGERLIMSDGSNVLFFRDPETFAETRHVEVLDGVDPVMDLNELEWIDGEVWANVWQTDMIVRINPATGAVLGWIDLTGLLQPGDQAGADVDVLNGIAVDEATGRIFVTGKLWPVLYEIELVAP
jgi:glutaminyl-peptide cyclotransferase